MMNDLPLSARMRETLGMTVAIWVGESDSTRQAAELLARTLDDAELFVRPENIVLVIDGCDRMVGPTESICASFEARCGGAPRIEVTERNEGQGGAVARGMQALLGDDDLQYVCTRDMDGDHDVYDMPQLYRRLVQLQEYEGTERAFAIGERADLHRPMGYARGELEKVLNEVTVEALIAAGRTPDIKHCRMYRQYPDFQSGFKMYTRWSGAAAARALWEADERWPELQPLKWGVQFISVIELLWQKATPASIQRLTFDGQPQSTFAGYDDLPVAYGRQLVWLFKRLQLAPGTAWSILDRSLARTLLVTVPDGQDTIVKLREHVAQDAWSAKPPPLQRGLMF